MRSIIEINKRTRELRVGVKFLRQCGCWEVPEGEISLVLRRDGCQPAPTKVLKDDGCNYWFEDVESEPSGVEYPLFEVGEDSELVFFFDDSLQLLPVGRYVGEVRVDNNVIVSFAVSLSETVYELSSLSKEQKRWNQ